MPVEKLLAKGPFTAVVVSGLVLIGVVATARQPKVRTGRLQIFWSQTGSLADPGRHLRSDLFVIVEGKHEVGPIRTSKRAK